MKALAKNRDERYATMADLVAALEGLGDELSASQPTLSLPALPPGADSAVLPPVTSSLVDTLPPPRRSKGETRPLHEPEFVAAPLTFEPVFQEPPPQEQHRRWPVVLLGLLVLAIGAGGMILVLGHLRHDEAAPGDAALVAHAADAAPLVPIADGAVPPADATAIVEVPVDAGARAMRDAGTAAVTGRHPKTVRVTVYVRPGDASVFPGADYRGQHNPTLEEPYGAKVMVEC
jgi:hypothetical protein